MSTYSDYYEEYAEAYEDDLPYLRSIVAEQYADLPVDELEDVFYRHFDEIDIDELEDFTKSLTKFGKSAGSALVKAAPGAISGALQGATAGAALGPYGALAGGALGAVGGGIQSHAASQQPAAAHTAARPTPAPAPQPVAAPALQAPAVPQRPPTTVPPAPQPVQPTPTISQPVATPPRFGQQGKAAAQLMRVLGHPQTIRAIASMVLEQMGRRTVTVEAVEIPVAQFAETISLLAQRAAFENQYETDIDTTGAEVVTEIDSQQYQDDLSDAWYRAAGLMQSLDQAGLEFAWPVDDDEEDDAYFSDDDFEHGFDIEFVDEVDESDDYDPSIFEERRVSV